jgi:hypothetical protein
VRAVTQAFLESCLVAVIVREQADSHMMCLWRIQRRAGHVCAHGPTSVCTGMCCSLQFSTSLADRAACAGSAKYTRCYRVAPLPAASCVAVGCNFGGGAESWSEPAAMQTQERPRQLCLFQWQAVGQAYMLSEQSESLSQFWPVGPDMLAVTAGGRLEKWVRLIILAGQCNREVCVPRQSPATG